MDGRDFTVGSVLRRTFRLIGRHRGDFAVAAGLLVFLPTLLVAALNAATTAAILTGRPPGPGQAGFPGSSLFGIGALGGIAGLLLGLVLYGIVISAALGDARGQARSLGRDAAASLRFFLPNLVIGMLFYLALVLGFTLLVVPGLMLQCAWYVVVPAYMAERPGLFRAFGRSRALTKGHRWRVFGVLLLYGVALGLVGGLNYFIILTLARNGIDGAVVWVYRVVYAAVATGVNVLGSAVPAAAYIELDRVKGGPLSSDLVEAFG